MARRASGLLLALLLTTVAAAGCRNSHLPGTEIPDTEGNRAIYERLMEYKQAMEARDIDRILSMTSRDYYENAGTTDRDTDDYGYETLRDEVLPKLRENIKAVHYRVIPRNIVVEGDRAYAAYEFFFRFKFVEGGNDGWAQKNDFNRLEFRREDGEWMIVSGL
ncbi:MAG: hypothetical protein ACQEXJ_01740 [Myxococcota bacterium]